MSEPGAPEGNRQQNQSQGEFKPSVLAANQADIDSITNPTLQRKVRVLHAALADDPNILDAAELKSEAEAVRRGIESGDYDQQEAGPVWTKLRAFAREKENQEKPRSRTSSLRSPEAVAAGLAGAAGNKILGEALKGPRKFVGSVIRQGQARFGGRSRPQSPSAGSGRGSGTSEPPTGGGNGGGGAAEQGSSDEGDNFSKMNYADLEAAEKRGSLTLEQKAQIVQEKEKLVEGLIKYDGGNFIDRIRRDVKNIVRENEWDKVYDKLIDFADDEEAIFKRVSDDDPRWEGLLRSAIYAEAANLSKEGIKKELAKNPNKIDDKWLEEHNYSKALRQRLDDDSKRRIERLELLPANAAELVGKKVSRPDNVSYRQAGGPPTQDELEQMMAEAGVRDAAGGGHERYVPIQAPKYIGAVFSGGLFENMFKHETIPVLDITKPEDRERFILENIHVFDTRFQQPGSWMGAVDEWLDEIGLATRANAKRIPQEERKRYVKELKGFMNTVKAVMATNTSALCMKKSNGSLEEYGVWLTAGGQGEKANLDIQDQYKDMILHGDPEKIWTVLKIPRVKGYFDKIMGEMGLNTDFDPKNPVINFVNGGADEAIERIRQTKYIAETDEEGNSIEEDGVVKTRTEYANQVVRYLSNEAAKGGFTGYIEDVLLSDFDSTSDEWDSEWAAARLATDVITTTGIFTQWDFAITNGKPGEEAKFKSLSGTGNPSAPLWSDRLGLLTETNSGGDPLRFLMGEASYLHLKIKQVYKDPLGREIMEDLDNAFEPPSVFAGDREKYKVKPTMTAKWKPMARLGRADWLVVKGSQAEGLSVWGRETAEELKNAALRLNEVYGNITEFNKDTGQEFAVGKHMAAKMMAEILELKAKALVAQRVKPRKLESVGDTIDITKHPNYEIMAAIWGPKLDAKVGLRADLAGTELNLVFVDNIFNAYDDLLRTKAILLTGDPHATKEQVKLYEKVIGGMNLLGAAGQIAGSKK